MLLSQQEFYNFMVENLLGPKGKIFPKRISEKSFSKYPKGLDAWETFQHWIPKMQSIKFPKSKEFWGRTKLNIPWDEVLVCKECGKPIRIFGVNFCSAKCGAKNSETREKFRETNLIKSGVIHPSKLEYIKRKKIETFKERYGCENPMQIEKVKKHFHKNLQTRLQKEYLTKKKNKTFKSSKEELKFFEYFKKYFPDAISHYRSVLYPWQCDIYIPSTNTFIEIQRSWTHGGRPYIKEECKEQLLKWKEKAKTSNYYKNAIKTWIQRDVEKRNWAKSHGLNYIEIFCSLEDYASRNSSKIATSSGLFV